MYGDCQVMSTMGGGCPPDPLFASSSPIRNPNHSNNFMSPFQSFPSAVVPKQENGLQIGGGRGGGSGGGGEEEIESGSQLSGQGGSADEQDLDQPPLKKKRYHRHTVRQIQEMEALFKECPHPDDKQRLKLSQDLGLKPRQVKFWFQNRRTQMKAQQDRAENSILRTENENLKNDIYRLQAALRSLTCTNCGGGEMSFGESQQLRIENARLKEELERLSCLISRNGMRPSQTLGPPQPPLLPSVDLGMSMYSRNFHEPMGTCNDMIPVTALQNSNYAGTNIIMEQDKQLAIELAMNAMQELIKMCQMSEPLWIPNDNGKEVLNLEEHSKMFSWPDNFKQDQSEFRTEATRDSAVVIMNSITLADAFLDANKWMELFPSIVARAKTLQAITSGISGHAGGSLHLMYADLQVLSPLVPTRETRFLRYCQQNIEEGTWAIVDFPVDNFPDSPQHSFPRYRRRPSGCIIQDMPNGYSRVTWVEHAEIEDKPVHQIFSQFVNSGMAFGARRWLAVLQQQCERVASLMARNISDLGVIPSPEARRNLMKLTQRMIKVFCFNLSTSGGQNWTALSDTQADTVRITTRKNLESGQPNGVILCASSTTWLPYSREQVFDLLRDERRRSQLDILSSGTSSQEVAHIANGSHPGTCISLIRINASSNSAQNLELMLQESSTDTFSSQVIYSSVDVDAIQLAMSGEDTNYIPILPSGFVVTPVDPFYNNNHMSNSGNSSSSPESAINRPASSCLLTVGVQVLATTIPSAKISLTSVTAVNNHICTVVEQIRAALGGGSSAELIQTSER